MVEQAKAVTVGPDDPRYADLAGRGSRRFAGRPDYVRLVCSTEQVVEAVQDAVGMRLRVAVRSGGHCLENFVADPAVRVVIDTSLMTAVSYDPEMKAFAISDCPSTKTLTRPNGAHASRSVMERLSATNC